MAGKHEAGPLDPGDWLTTGLGEGWDGAWWMASWLKLGTRR